MRVEFQRYNFQSLAKGIVSLIIYRTHLVIRLLYKEHELAQHQHLSVFIFHLQSKSLQAKIGQNWLVNPKLLGSYLSRPAGFGPVPTPHGMFIYTGTRFE